MKKIFCVFFCATFAIISSKTAYGQNTEDVDALISEFYNNFTSEESNRTIKEKIEQLIKLRPENPHLYSFWASVEWVLIGRELGLALGDKKNISDNEIYAPRITRHEQMVKIGLEYTEKIDSEKELAKAALLLEKSKLQYRFLGNIRDADKTSAKIIQIIDNSPSCYKYFYLGSMRFSMSNRSRIERLGIYILSDSYAELYKIDRDVFNKNKSIEWLERAYQCEQKSMGQKKTWIETTFFLANAYNTYRKGLQIEDELPILEKETKITGELNALFPKNNDLAKRHKLNKLRQETLTYYLKRK